MKFLALLLFVAVAQASVLRNTVISVAAPRLERLTALDPLGISIKWKPVVGSYSNPVVGYKVNVWEQQKKIVHEYEMVDGVYQLVENEVLIPFPKEVSDWNPKEIFVQGAQTDVVSYHGIKTGYMYEVRVQAITIRGYSPLSNPMRIRLGISP